jgi:hypothetical protein
MTNSMPTASSPNSSPPDVPALLAGPQCIPVTGGAGYGLRPTA